MTEQRPSTESELVDFVRAIDTPAPESLHRAVQSLAHASGRVQRSPGSGSSDGRARTPFGLWPRMAAVGAIAAAALAVAIAVSASGGHTSPLGIGQAAAVTLRAAETPAPAQSRRDRARLADAVDGVSFPYWEDRFGWRASGSRSDRLDGRAITTVFYTDAHGRRIGYAIVAGTPAPRVSGGVTTMRGHTTFRLLHEDGAEVVSWLRHGHLCIVSGRGMRGSTLLLLASWDLGRSIAT